MAVPIKVTGGALEAGAPIALFAPKVLGIDNVDSGLQYRRVSRWKVPA